MGRGDLSDAQWSLIKGLMPVQERGGTWNDHRTTVDGMLWVLRTGAPWRDLPERYGKWQSVYDRFNRWRREGLFGRILRALRIRLDKAGKIDWDLWLVDGSNVRASGADVVAHSMGGQNTRFYLGGFTGSVPRRHLFGTVVAGAVVYSTEATAFASIDVPSRSVPADFDRPVPLGPLVPRQPRFPQLLYAHERNHFAGDIHRFVAVGSPFDGSPLANDLMESMSNRNSGTVDAILSTAAAKLIGMQLINPNDDWLLASSADLAQDSTAERLCEDGFPGVSYPEGRRAVPWAPLAGRCACSQDATWLEKLVSGLPLQSRVFRALKSNNSDGVVLISSQLNEVVPSTHPYYVFGSHQHSEAFPNLNVPESMSPYSAERGQPGVGGILSDRLSRPRWASSFWFFEGMGQ